MGVQNKNIKGNNTKEMTSVKTTDTLVDKLNVFLEKRLNLLFIISLILMVIISYALFDVRISLSGDDAAYIERAKKFLDHFAYPSYQGPLYPIFLSFFIAIFGMNVVLLKIVSLFCMLGFQAFTYLTLRQRVPALLSSAVLLLIAVNAEVLYYASQTYSEAFYMLLVAWGLWFYVTHFIDRAKEYSWTKQAGMALILGCILLSMGLARSVGYVGLITVLFFGLCFRKYWKDTVMLLIGFVVVYLCWSLLKWICWGNGSAEFSTQLSMLLQKDVYNANMGQEDLTGFLVRFWQNTNNYISFHFYEILGLRKFVVTMPTSSLISLLTIALALTGLLVAYRKNKVMFLLGVYAGSFLVLTFFIMQVFWKQGRLIVPVVPYLLLLLLFALYYFPVQKWRTLLHTLLPILLVVLLMTEVKRLSGKVKETTRITNKYYGLTPDWINYIQASEWAAIQLPREAVIGCRKPSISFVYGQGRNFYGIMNVPTASAGEFLEVWKERPEEYAVILQSELEKPLPAASIKTFRTHLEAYYFTNNQGYFVIKGEAEVMTDFKHQLELAGIKTTDSLSLREKDFVVYPDVLLGKLKEHSVDYIITANLRSDPTRKTQRTINTVERYLRYISQKYPQLFVKIAQIGKDNDEPASVWQVDYSQLPAN